MFGNCYWTCVVYTKTIIQSRGVFASNVAPRPASQTARVTGRLTLSRRCRSFSRPWLTSPPGWHPWCSKWSPAGRSCTTQEQKWSEESNYGKPCSYSKRFWVEWTNTSVQFSNWELRDCKSEETVRFLLMRENTFMAILANPAFRIVNIKASTPTEQNAILVSAYGATSVRPYAVAFSICE